jgi:autonomous glycyl radical cofactor GrcA
MMDRERAVLTFKDIRTLKRMMSAYSADIKDVRRGKSWNVEHEIRGLCERMKLMRKGQRDRSADPLQVKKSFALNAEKDIKRCLTDICSKRKFNETIIVGGKDTGTCEYKEGINRYSKPTVTLCVGHMWYRNVFKNIYDHNRLVQNDYIILSAVEYRTNVPHVRLYEAVAYGISEKGQVNGWIGQSKLGEQLCSFRTDKQAAIQAAQRLTVRSVNEQISGETNG